MQLRSQEKLIPTQIEHIDIETFDVAYRIIGGGDEGDKTLVSVKEQADHSLPYLVSVALLDGQVMPEQFLAERMQCVDLQELLAKVSVHPIDEFSNRFPHEMPCRLTITLRKGRVLTKELHDYPGFVTQPLSWEMAFEKFERLTSPLTTTALRPSIADTVKNLESAQVREFTRLLSLETPRHDARKVPGAGKE